MASRKTQKTPATNGGRVTLRDLLGAVQGVNTRIDGVHTRIDEAVQGQQELSGQMNELHGAMHELRDATNDRLHAMKADVATLKRPWDLLASGWTKAGAAAGAAVTLTSVITLELWHYLPFLPF